MIGCSAFNYMMALFVARQHKTGPAQAWVLPVSIIANLSVLFFFKYFNFFATSLTEFAALFGATVSPVTLQVVLPVGISFFTFQAMSYFFDVYRKDITAEKASSTSRSTSLSSRSWLRDRSCALPTSCHNSPVGGSSQTSTCVALSFCSRSASSRKPASRMASHLTSSGFLPTRQPSMPFRFSPL